MLVVVSTAVVGVWLVHRAVSPWIGTLREMKRLEREGPYRYRADTRSTQLYSELENAYFAVKRRDHERALELLTAAAHRAPNNPLFDYFEAAVRQQQGRRDLALAAIRAGNSKGTLRLYSSREVPPERWQWPQFDLIRYSGKRLASDPETDAADLKSLIVMGDRMVFSEPPDPVRLVQGIEVRQAAAERLLQMPDRRADPEIARLCIELIDEGRALRAGIRRRIDEEKPFHDDARAWIIARAVRSSDPRFRQAAALVYLEKQADWADQLRKSYLRRRNLQELRK